MLMAIVVVVMEEIEMVTVMVMVRRWDVA